MPPKPIQQWESDLNNAIAEVMVGDAEIGDGSKLLQEAFCGLIDIFDCLPEVRERGRIRLVKRLNEEPINIAAKKWLTGGKWFTSGWAGKDRLHVLSLMLWGITEAKTVPSYWETDDLACELVAKMLRWNPAYVMALLQNPEHPELADEEVNLTSDDLSKQAFPDDAAWLLMEQLKIAVMNKARIKNDDTVAR